MSRTTEFLMNIRSIIKLHESMLREICGEYQLALIEATIISFLHNNPGKDTCLLYTSPSPRDRQKSRMPSSA